MPPENLMQFLQQLMTPAAPDATGFAHDEIDELIEKPKPKPSDYGKPFEYVSSNVGTPKAHAIPLNMSKYAELIEKSEVGKVINRFVKSKVPLSWNFLNEPASSPDTLATGRAWKSVEASQKKAMKEWGPEELQSYIVSKLKRGDDPSGIVAYYLDKYIDPEGIGGRYSPGRKFSDPDTVSIYQSTSRVTSPEGWSGVSQAKAGFDLFGESAAGEYGTVLHEAIHSIFSHPEEWKKPGGQLDYEKVVKEMASNLKQKYGESLMKSLMDDLLGVAPINLRFEPDTSRIKQLPLDPLQHLYRDQ